MARVTPWLDQLQADNHRQLETDLLLRGVDVDVVDAAVDTAYTMWVDEDRLLLLAELLEFLREDEEKRRAFAAAELTAILRPH